LVQGVLWLQLKAGASEWILENKANCASFKAMRRKEAQHPIEIIGAKLRGMMSWLSK